MLLGPCETALGQRGANWSSYPLPKTAWAKYLKQDEVPSLAKECPGDNCDGLDWSTANNQQPKRVVIDTDLDNEVDDYLAVAWALLSSVGPSRELAVESIIAAPFSFRYKFLPLAKAQQLFEKTVAADSNSLSDVEQQFLYGASPGSGGMLMDLLNLKDINTDPRQMIEQDNHAIWCANKGMEESYQGLLRLLELFKQAKVSGMAPAYAELSKTNAYRGQTEFITGSNPESRTISDGVQDLIARARNSTVEDPLYVISIAAPTNVAAALLAAPDIVGKIIVLWDAGFGLEDRRRVATAPLNSGSDPVAARVLLESGVRLFYFPGFPALQTFQLSMNDARAWYQGQGAVSSAIYERYINNPDLQFSGNGITRYNRKFGTTRIMWDVAPMVPFILPSLAFVDKVQPAVMKQVETASGCNGFESIGTTCKAVHPNTGNLYMCQSLNPYDQTMCDDGFFVEVPKDESEPFKRQVLQATGFGGSENTGGVSMNLLNKLANAGL